MKESSPISSGFTIHRVGECWAGKIAPSRYQGYPYFSFQVIFVLLTGVFVAACSTVELARRETRSIYRFWFKLTSIQFRANHEISNSILLSVRTTPLTRKKEYIREWRGEEGVKIKKKEKKGKRIRSIGVFTNRKSCKFRNGAKEENPILVGSFASLLNALERIPPVSSQIPKRTWKLMAGSRWYFAFKDLFGSRSFLTAGNNLLLRRVNLVNDRANRDPPHPDSLKL